MRGSLLRTESLEVLTSKKWAALLRGARAVGDRVSVFAQTTFLRDVS